MRRTKTWFAGMLLGSVALGVMCDNLFAQAWQPKWTSDNGPSSEASADWQQRVLKQSQPAQQNVYQQVPADSYRVAQRPSPDRGSYAAVAGAEMPGAPSRQRANWVSGGEEVIEPGAVSFDPVASEGVFAGNGRCAACGGVGGCDQCGEAACDDGCDFGWEVFDGRCGSWLRGLSVFAGADGFKGPLDRGTNGSFGLNEGLNLARPLGDPWGCGYQIGANFVQSNFSARRLSPFQTRKVAS